MKKLTAISALALLIFDLTFPFVMASDTDVSGEPVVFSNIARSEKRILKDDSDRDEKLRLLTGHDMLTGEIIDQHSLIVGSKIIMVCRSTVYSWLVDHIEISTALSRLFGMKYHLSPGSKYEYHGVDGEGLTIDFYRAYSDSNSTVFVGDGKFKIFLVTISGSFINLLEYYNTDRADMTTQSCIYVKVNNPVTRFFANIIFALSDIEEGIMKKILSLDDTVFKMVDTLMQDPYLYLMLKEPDAPFPEGASELAVKMKDIVVRKSSLKQAREFGLLIEKAKFEVEYQ